LFLNVVGMVMQVLENACRDDEELHAFSMIASAT
jgi:hypothetical protein